jgi:hypothetical protein
MKAVREWQGSVTGAAKSWYLGRVDHPAQAMHTTNATMRDQGAVINHLVVRLL